MHGQVKALAHGVYIGTMAEIHLNASDGKRLHWRVLLGPDKLT
jgi:hypothetical protein